MSPGFLVVKVHPALVPLAQPSPPDLVRNPGFKRDLAGEVARLRAVPPEVSATLTDFMRDPAVFRRFRETLAEWIERLALVRP